MKTVRIWWVLAGALLLAIAASLVLFSPGVVGLMDRHQGVSGWVQAVFSVIAILASAGVSILIPREQRRLEKRDICIRALSLAAICLEHSRKMLSTVAHQLRLGVFSEPLARVARLELEVRLEELSRTPIEAIPEDLAHHLFEGRALVRSYCGALIQVEDGKIKPAQIALEPLETVIASLEMTERWCREVLGEHTAKVRRPSLIDSGVSLAPGVVGVIGGPAPERTQPLTGAKTS